MPVDPGIPETGHWISTPQKVLEERARAERAEAECERLRAAAEFWKRGCYWMRDRMQYAVQSNVDIAAQRLDALKEERAECERLRVALKEIDALPTVRRRELSPGDYTVEHVSVDVAKIIARAALGEADDE